MSTFTETERCPKCGENYFDVTTSSDASEVAGACLNCGYFYGVHENQYTLEELNEQRVECDLPPLEKLPKIDVTVFPAFVFTPQQLDEDPHQVWLALMSTYKLPEETCSITIAGTLIESEVNEDGLSYW